MIVSGTCTGCGGLPYHVLLSSLLINVTFECRLIMTLSIVICEVVDTCVCKT